MTTYEQAVQKGENKREYRTTKPRHNQRLQRRPGYCRFR